MGAYVDLLSAESIFKRAVDNKVSANCWGDVVLVRIYT